MKIKTNRAALIGAALLVSAGASKSMAQDIFNTGDLLVSSSTYAGSASTVTVGQSLPGGGTATANGSFGPTGVFTNDAADASFGVTAPISISQITTSGAAADFNTSFDQNGLDVSGNTISLDPTVLGSTSFSSKSELAINLSTNGTSLTFMDYDTTPNQLDISNSNTPGILDPNNPDSATPTYRQVVQINANGTTETTTTNAYDGNNGRAAILDNNNGLYYTVGNAGNGGNYAENTSSTGVQIITPGQNATSSTPGVTQAGLYNITQNGDAADKVGKDNNFRGLTINNNTLYVTKGSGSNGINTAYQVGTTGSIPTVNTTNPGSINILPGFSTTLSNSSSDVEHPFGMFFANATTLYVADEGNGSTADETNPSTSNPYAGLQKYSLNTNTNVWSLDYTLTLGLNLGQAYTVNGQGGSYTAYTDGLRNLTGVVNANGTVSLYAITSTVDNYTNEDFGADPNELVAITDTLADTSASQVTGESFTTLEQASAGTVLRGVSFTPVAAPEPGSWALAGICLAVFAWLRQRTGRKQA